VLFIVATTSKICSACPSTHRRQCPSLLHACQSTSPHRSRQTPQPPSILVYPKFDRYVVTRFLADSTLHGHRPTVLTWSSTLLLVVFLAAYPASSFFASCRSCLPQSAHWQGSHRHTNLCRCPTHSEFVDCVHILSTASSYPPAAVLRDISTGTSYLIVRLVFRPYVHFSSSN